MGTLQKVRITKAPYRGVQGILSFDKEGEPWITFQDPGLQWIHVPADGSEEPLGDPYESDIVRAYTGEEEEEEVPEKWYEIRVTFEVRLLADSPKEAKQQAADLIDPNDWIDGRGSWEIRETKLLSTHEQED